jgi:hypothetical protein
MPLKKLLLFLNFPLLLRFTSSFIFQFFFFIFIFSFFHFSFFIFHFSFFHFSFFIFHFSFFIFHFHLLHFLKMKQTALLLKDALIEGSAIHVTPESEVMENFFFSSKLIPYIREFPTFFMILKFILQI